MWKLFFINSLSILRIPLSFVFCIYILENSKNFFLFLGLFGLILLTDFLDGRLARKFHVETNIGAALDTGTDLFFMISAGGTLYFKNLFPLEILVLMFLKYFEFFITSWIYFKRRKSEKFFLYDKLGKTIAVSYYCLPVIFLFLNGRVSQDVFYLFGKGIFIFLALLSLLSSTFRIKKILFYHKV